MFSLLVRVSTATQLGQRISFLQHMASLAVVQGIITMRGYEVLNEASYTLTLLALSLSSRQYSRHHIGNISLSDH